MPLLKAGQDAEIMQNRGDYFVTSIKDGLLARLLLQLDLQLPYVREFLKSLE